MRTASAKTKTNKIVGSSKVPLSVRLSLLVISISWVFQKRYIKSKLLPFGSPQKLKWSDRPTFATVDPNNDSLSMKSNKLSKIYERRHHHEEEKLLTGPETVFFGPNTNNMYIVNEMANLIQLSDFQTDYDDDKNKITAKTTFIADLGPGRPLGASFTPDGTTLYIADSVLGLTRIKDPHNTKSKVEIVATTVFDKGERTRIHFADDLIVGPKTGLVYFTDGMLLFFSMYRRIHGQLKKKLIMLLLIHSIINQLIIL